MLFQQYSQKQKSSVCIYPSQPWKHWIEKKLFVMKATPATVRPMRIWPNKCIDQSTTQNLPVITTPGVQLMNAGVVMSLITWPLCSTGSLSSRPPSWASSWTTSSTSRTGTSSPPWDTPATTGHYHVQLRLLTCTTTVTDMYNYGY